MFAEPSDIKTSNQEQPGKNLLQPQRFIELIVSICVRTIRTAATSQADPPPQNRTHTQTRGKKATNVRKTQTNTVADISQDSGQTAQQAKAKQETRPTGHGDPKEQDQANNSSRGKIQFNQKECKIN